MRETKRVLAKLKVRMLSCYLELPSAIKGEKTTRERQPKIERDRENVEQIESIYTLYHES